MIQKGDYRKLFDSPDGKRVLEDLSDYCYENKSTFIQGDNPNNVHMEHHNQGKRAVILYIRERMKE